jgi:Rrf2 family protein
MVHSRGAALSSRDLAEFQGISPSFMAKIFPRLEKAGIVRASKGVRGGYVLARAPEEISFLEIVDAIEGRKPLFDCQEIRGRCAVFDGAPPTWATQGVCAVHVVMLKAEKAMRDILAGQSLGDLADAVAGKAPPKFGAAVGSWIGARVEGRVRKGQVSSPCEREAGS